MMRKEFNSLEEIEKYYDENTYTYVFKKNGVYIDSVKFNFNLEVRANIDASVIDAFNIIAWNIKAGNIKAHDIYADDIFAFNIIANDISYYGVCVAYESIKCKSIEGRRANSKHFVLDGEIEVEEDE